MAEIGKQYDDSTWIIPSRCLIGRSSACQLRVECPETSGEHALLRWTGAALVEVGRVQLSADEIRAATASRPLVAADLDGDGADELVHGVRVGSMSGMRVVRGVGTGSPAVRVVGGVLPQAALDLDDDAAEELLVSVEPNLDAWVLGDGERAPPDLRAPVLRPPPLALADPKAKLAFGYVCNKMDYKVRPDKTLALCRALYASVAA